MRTDFHVTAARGTASQENRITLAAARYASEEAAALVHYAIALIEYTKLCQPLHSAKQKVEKLKHDIIEAEQKQAEKESEVRVCCCSSSVVIRASEGCRSND